MWPCVDQEGLGWLRTLISEHAQVFVLHAHATPTCTEPLQQPFESASTPTGESLLQSSHPAARKALINPVESVDYSQHFDLRAA